MPFGSRPGNPRNVQGQVNPNADGSSFWDKVLTENRAAPNLGQRSPVAPTFQEQLEAAGEYQGPPVPRKYLPPFDDTVSSEDLPLRGDGSFAVNTGIQARGNAPMMERSSSGSGNVYSPAPDQLSPLPSTAPLGPPTNLLEVTPAVAADQAANTKAEAEAEQRLSPKPPSESRLSGQRGYGGGTSMADMSNQTTELPPGMSRDYNDRTLLEWLMRNMPYHPRMQLGTSFPSGADLATPYVRR